MIRHHYGEILAGVTYSMEHNVSLAHGRSLNVNIIPILASSIVKNGSTGLCLRVYQTLSYTYGGASC